jgi:large subunit ribosomal protein L33
MAKKKEIIHLQCVDCKKQNYTIRRAIKSGIEKNEKLELSKFCSFCKKRTTHKEVKASKKKKK